MTCSFRLLGSKARSQITPIDSWSSQPRNYVHNWTSPTTIKRKKHHTCKHVLFPDHVSMPAMWSVSWAALKKGSDAVAASSYAAEEKSQKRWCQSQRHTVQHSLDRHVKRWKKASCFTLLRRITNSKLWIRKSFQRVKFLPGKVFTEGFMPPWRIQHESRTCLETFYRIIDVKCIGRAKNTPITPGTGNWKIRNKYIYYTMVTTSCDLDAPRCATTVPQVRFHGSRGGVFVGHRPARDPGGPPAKYRSLTSIQMVHTHIHTQCGHSCSELPLRILLWDTRMGHILSAKTLPVHLTGRKGPENK